ncbi:response regulator [Flavobacterium pectinovorum]|uniref:response regulator n=1 Tax=Flavobacterium pectinovorum TaxID=29533 RepID=UPI00265EB266|nr:response regulator [Flavobacterium pectinovorum]WKL50112.1 response regulator [Flavobacterium pectinovorum]
MTYNILIVDENKMILDTYINLLSKIDFHTKNINIINSTNCEIAYRKINFYLNQNINIDLVLIDIDIPPYKEFMINNGFDIALLLRKKMKNCKIIFLTMLCKPLVVDKIIKDIIPEGFASKKEIDHKLFLDMCEKIINGELFISPIIAKAQREMIKKNMNWDNYDTEIVQLIFEGIKTVNIPRYIPLSISAIEKRKAKIKGQLLRGKGNDKDLIFKARNLGLI